MGVDQERNLMGNHVIRKEIVLVHHEAKIVISQKKKNVTVVVEEEVIVSVQKIVIEEQKESGPKTAIVKDVDRGPDRNLRINRRTFTVIEMDEEAAGAGIEIYVIVKYVAVVPRIKIKGKYIKHLMSSFF